MNNRIGGHWTWLKVISQQKVKMLGWTSLFTKTHLTGIFGMCMKINKSITIKKNKGKNYIINEINK